MDDTCIYVEPDELAEVISITMPRARKQHVCGECREPIIPGQRYERSVLKYDNALSMHITCVRCMTIRDEYFTCGWYYGEIWAWIHQEKCMAEDDGFCLCPPRAPKTSLTL